jgi:hypothetical protein
MNDLYTSTAWRQYDDLPPRIRQSWLERNLGTLVRIAAVLLLLLVSVEIAHFLQDLSVTVADAIVPASTGGLSLVEG